MRTLKTVMTLGILFSIFLMTPIESFAVSSTEGIQDIVGERKKLR